MSLGRTKHVSADGYIYIYIYLSADTCFVLLEPISAAWMSVELIAVTLTYIYLLILH